MTASRLNPFSTTTTTTSSSPAPHHNAIPFSISDLSKKDITNLTHILSRPPTTPTTHTLHHEIHALPPHLRAPIPAQRTITSLFPPATNLPPAAPLCRTHARLNAQLTHTILASLKKELHPQGPNALLFHLLHAHHHQHQLLNPAQTNLLHTLIAAQALYLPPHTYLTAHGTSPAPDPAWAFQADSCAACILSRVGASAEVVLALKAVLVSRRKKGRGPPRLGRWVDGWVGALGGQEGERVRVLGGAEGRELRGLRRGFRRGLAGGVGDGVGEGEGEGEGEDEDEGEDVEDEIIGLYAGLPSSTAELPLLLPLPNADGERGWDRGVGEAEMRADEYRALLGSRASSDRLERQRRSGSTTWSAFCRR